MKTKPWLILSILASGALLALQTGAEEIVTVQADRVNVRGQPSLIGEVITQLKSGDSITILEEIKVAKPKPGEPTNWFRIQMPVNTPVWVFASYIDPTNKTVLPPKLNVRAGAGDNFSVVGQIVRGDVVKEIRLSENWMEIETPKSAYGFVASEFIAKAAVEAAKATAPPVVIDADKATEKPATVPIPEPIKPQEVTLPPEPVIADVVPTPPAEPKTPASQPKVVVSETVTMPPVIQPPSPQPEAVLSRRVVTREGVVRSSVSIQAPTYYELVSPETRKTINYLHSTSTNIVIKQYRSQSIVVTGEEFIDSRWLNTPVLEVETLEPAP
jgi:uncharacterized protein YgiM (DUF1202 family)